MRMTHPQAPYQGIAPENVFFVANDQGAQMGMGYVMMFTQFELYPEQPLHLYIHMEAQPYARSMLFGALYARAEVLRAECPQMRARLYATLSPGDTDMLDFYTKMGMRYDDAEDLYRFPLPAIPSRTPMGCQLASVPLRNEPEQQTFLARLNQYRISPIPMDYLILSMQQQHFLALGLYRASQPICECLITGTGSQASLTMLYVASPFRRQGFAKSLLAAASSLLSQQQTTHFAARAYRRSVPQQALMHSMQATRVQTIEALPGMEI